MTIPDQTNPPHNPEKIHIATLMQESGVAFGASGARGLVRNMTDQFCYAYTAAFLQSGRMGRALRHEGRNPSNAGDGCYYACEPNYTKLLECRNDHS